MNASWTGPHKGTLGPTIKPRLDVTDEIWTEPLAQ